MAHHRYDILPSVRNNETSSILRNKITDFWDSEPCGTRYLDAPESFAAHAAVRYRLEPHIAIFAQFASARGKRILEVGVGLGADYLEWLRAGAIATGIDLSPFSIEQARRRCETAGYKPDLQTGDGEHLTFQSDTFDVVYSYGVMHHSPDVQRCIDEAWRVLKPGGEARIMLYHHPSLTGLMLWLRFGLLRRKPVRQTVYEHLESPGTKSFSRAEVRAMMRAFEMVELQQVFSPGDLLLHRPSLRFTGFFYRIVWILYPRFLIAVLCRKLGLFLLVSGRKPVSSQHD